MIATNKNIERCPKENLGNLDFQPGIQVGKFLTNIDNIILNISSKITFIAARMANP